MDGLKQFVARSWRPAVLALNIIAALGVLWLLGLFKRYGVLDHWQTLASGVLAILAAVIGGGFVLSQVRQADAQERERLRRRHAAARAVMPLTLGAMMEYARGCGRALRILYLSNRANSVPRAAFQDFELPSVPADAVSELARMIEAADAAVADAIARVLRDLQVQDGRLRGMRADALDPHANRRNVPKLEVEQYIIDAAELYARCENLLDYARGEDEVVKPDLDAQTILRALFLMSYHATAFDRVKQTIRNRHNPVVAPIEAV